MGPAQAIMNSCSRVLLFATCAVVCGCSGYGTSEHFEVVNDGTLVRYQIHDWYEEETTGPSVGVYRPPVYGFEQSGQTYAIYPVFIRHGVRTVGPPIAPVWPVPQEQGHSMVLSVRHRNGGTTPSHQRRSGWTLSPRQKCAWRRLHQTLLARSSRPGFRSPNRSSDSCLRRCRPTEARDA